jgi:hypothetical protein
MSTSGRSSGTGRPRSLSRRQFGRIACGEPLARSGVDGAAIDTDGAAPAGLADGGTIASGQDARPPEYDAGPLPPGSPRPEALRVATHRRLIAYYGDDLATDAGAAQACDFVPWRAWGGFVVSPEGRAYYLGGGHGDYHGTEVDTCDLTAIAPGGVMPWRQNLGPTRDGGTEFPPAGDPDDYQRTHVPRYPDDPTDGMPNTGYCCAGSNWMWFHAGVPGSWQHDAIHMYANATTHPTLGLFMMGNVPRDLLMPADRRDHTGDGESAIRSWSATTGKWTAHVTGLPGSGNQRGAGDWNRAHGYYLTYQVESSDDRALFQQWSPERGLESAPLMSLTSDMVPNRIPSGGCIWLHDHEFLIWRTSLGGGPAKMWRYTHSLTAPRLSDITPALWSEMQAATSENGYFCADHEHRTIWLMEGGGTEPPRLHRSSFDDPGTFAELRMEDEPAFRPASNAVVSAGMRGIQYFGGYLWTVTIGDAVPGADGRTAATRFWRIRVA